MVLNKFPIFTQAETVTYTGAVTEAAITLDRGTRWSIQRVEVYAPSAGEGSKIQIFRKSSATTANERDPSHADSKGVLMNEFYLDASNRSVRDMQENFSDLGDTGLRIRMDLGSDAQIAYVNITYAYDGTI